jgi:hypothetical protein
MRKLCIDEVGRVKMKKNGNKRRFAIRKNVFSLLLFFGLFLWLCIYKGDLQSLRRHSYNILNHSKMEKN